ncbi:MAG: mechanosensitive ion channel [Xanthomonadales bacterium]|jgi:small conductance mechanosensitive channel|nr:mechanosensitive ion channel [Xanthomonadales bacterium]
MESFLAFFTSDEFVPMLIGWASKIVLALAIYVVGKWIVGRVTRMVRKLMQVRDVDPTLVTFLANIVQAVLLVAVIIAALDTLGLPVTSLLAVVGAAGLAVGLALKDSLGNFAAGVMLVMFRPFTKGDYVDVAGVSGSIDDVRIFSTILTTPDNKQITIPNAQVYAGTITNYTAKDKRRVDMVFGVSYDDDLKVAREVLTRVCTSHPKVLAEPAFNIFVSSLGDSSVNFAVRPWAKTEDYWAVWGDVLEQGKAELEKAGCSIPYPQRDVHMHATNPITDLLKG